jgi:hypothetical protein
MPVTGVLFELGEVIVHAGPLTFVQAKEAHLQRSVSIPFGAGRFTDTINSGLPLAVSVPELAVMD